MTSVASSARSMQRSVSASQPPPGQQVIPSLPHAEPAEILDAPSRRLEQVMTRIRLAEGCPTDLLDPPGRAAASQAVADGLLEAVRATTTTDTRVRLTAHGRQLADHVLRQVI